MRRKWLLASFTLSLLLTGCVFLEATDDCNHSTSIVTFDLPSDIALNQSLRIPSGFVMNDNNGITYLFDNEVNSGQPSTDFLTFEEMLYDHKWEEIHVSRLLDENKELDDHVVSIKGQGIIEDLWTKKTIIPLENDENTSRLSSAYTYSLHQLDRSITFNVSKHGVVEYNSNKYYIEGIEFLGKSYISHETWEVPGNLASFINSSGIMFDDHNHYSYVYQTERLEKLSAFIASCTPAEKPVVKSYAQTITLLSGGTEIVIRDLGSQLNIIINDDFTMLNYPKNVNEDFQVKRIMGVK